MSTPFERGKSEEQWTRKELEIMGFSSPQDCLKFQETRIEKELEVARDEKQRDYLNGKLQGMRESLGSME